MTPFGEACWRVDLSGMHELLEKLGYGEDDVVVTNEVHYIFEKHISFDTSQYLIMRKKILLQFSFQMWTGQMQENMDYKKHGDAAFRAKDFETAIEFYTEVSF